MLPKEFEDNFSGTVPIFPLPNVVFFPGTKLPLHIFEPRYRQMLTDVHQGEQLISVVLLDRNEKMDPHTQSLKPPVHQWAGLGKLTRVERLPNGLFNIELFGLSRIRILEELDSDKPYRLARVKMVPDRLSDIDQAKSEELLQQAFDAFNRVLRKYSTFPGEFLTRFKGLPLGILLDILAHHLPCDSQKKQALLEEVEPVARCQKIIAMLENIYDGGGPKHTPSVVSLFPHPSVN